MVLAHLLSRALRPLSTLRPDDPERRAERALHRAADHADLKYRMRRLGRDDESCGRLVPTRD